MAIGLPGAEVLPPGPRRDLAVALHRLYTEAGRPSTRNLARAIDKDSASPATVGRETLGQLLNGNVVPDWPRTESVVRRLAADSVHRPDVEEEVRRFHSLWCADRDHDPTAEQIPKAHSSRARCGSPVADDHEPVRMRDFVLALSAADYPSEDALNEFAAEFASVMYSLPRDAYAPVPPRLLLNLLAHEVHERRRHAAEALEPGADLNLAYTDRLVDFDPPFWFAVAETRTVSVGGPVHAGRWYYAMWYGGAPPNRGWVIQDHGGFHAMVNEAELNNDVCVHPSVDEPTEPPPDGVFRGLLPDP